MKESLHKPPPPINPREIQDMDERENRFSTLLLRSMIFDLNF